MIYKRGQTIQIKSESFFLNHPRYQGKNDIIIYVWPYFTPEMLKYCGKTCKIEKVNHERGYYILDNTENWWWDDWMFETRNEKIKKMLK